ncbi:MAG: (Fe-S)-binding protein [Candidatus Sedimenticola endophacoides]
MKAADLLQAADQCVKCGLCLPHCPTYRLSRDEGDSPRGRIALIQALAREELEADDVRRPLGRCLLCRNCERACPSGVRYARLLDAARGLPGGAVPAPRWLARLPYRSGLRRLLAYYGASRLRPLVRHLGGARLRRLDALLPATPAAAAPWGVRHHPRRPDGTRVGLFLGCATQVTEAGALRAAITVLKRLGAEVVIPPDQGCCGAMHQHNGDAHRALEMARRNRRAFGAQPLDAVIGIASGCLLQLLEPPDGAAPDAPPREICRYLNASPSLDRLSLAPLGQRVALHAPCSERALPGPGGESERLLRRIPGIRLLRLGGEDCCGGAGTHLLNQRQLAETLRQPLLDTLAGEAVGILATTNSGCAIHLREGIRARGLDIEVVHPVELIARQLREGEG